MIARPILDRLSAVLVRESSPFVELPFLFLKLSRAPEFTWCKRRFAFPGANQSIENDQHLDDDVRHGTVCRFFIAFDVSLARSCNRKFDQRLLRAASNRKT